MRTLSTFMVASLAWALGTGAAPAATCDGPNPAITSVTAKQLASGGSLTHYQITGTVTNLGTQAQGKDVLQFVDISLAGEKLDAKGVPPLGPGQSYTFTYDYARSSDAGSGSTKLLFAIDMTQAPGMQDCNPANGQYVLTL